MLQEPDYAADFARAAARLAKLVETDPQIAAAVPDPAVTAAIQTPGLSYQQIIATVLAGYAGRPALGVRAYEVRAGARHHQPAFTTISYRELAQRVEAIASAWRHDPRHRVSPGEFVSYISFTGAEMTALDFACVYAQAIGVPVQANLPPADMREILQDVAPVTMIASIDHLAIATDYVLGQESVRSLIVIDADERVDADRAEIEAARARLGEADGRVALATFAEIVALGRDHSWSPLPTLPEGSDALSMLMYTSGSTGTPKGALFHEAMCTQFWSGLPLYQPTIAVAYAPMNHSMGRNMVFSVLAQGGASYFSLKSDLSTLLEDVRLVRPTWHLFLPRFAELVYQHYLSEVQRLVSAGADAADADRQVRAAMRSTYLGDRLVIGGVGSSPTAPEVRAFMRECFEIAFIEGYGTTEAGGGAAASGNRILRNVVIDYKLRDVPELGYYTTDKPFPRGELLIKTRLQFKGYFKRPEASAKVFDENGYVITGDIMEERGPDHLVWVDRRNNVIKLSQAEYVAIGPLEAAYLAENPLVSQIYVYGSSYRSFLLAVVVPDVDYARAQLGHEPSNEELRAMAQEQLQVRARVAGLKSFEIPRDVLIEREPFSLENGLLSSVRKPLRPNLKRRYADRLEAMYQEMDRKQQEELAQLRAQGSGLTTIERVAGALKANLGLASVDPRNPQSYRDLGGDSLGAVSLAMLLEEMFDITVPVSIILDPAGSAERLAQFVDRAVAGGGDTPTFASVHGDDPASVRASDLILPAFLDEETLEAAAEAAPPSAETRTVLLTGSTGFLGRFLCLEWMEALSAKGGKVIAIVRAPDDATARARLDEVIGTLDPALTRHYQALAKDHLEVIAGDLAAPRLGQDDEAFARLAREVDRIVHPGALVNHRLSYQNLFEPNVVGTAELIRLALTGRQKSFDYVSTVGVPHMNPVLRDASEDADVRDAAPDMPLGDAYALGYGASKWAGEVLLRDAHERFGLPVNVFRPNMILAHSRHVGQINVPDMFTRLLFSVVTTGIAPRSFYQLEADGHRPRAHYDGMPVDILAAALRGIGERPHAGFQSYNAINMHHDDGVSLDSYVDWIESAGYPVQRIADHADWFQRFGDKLRNLPEEERQRSSLNILGHLSQPHPADPARVSTARFEAASKGGVPHIDEAFIHKYLGDMVALGLIEEPQTARAASVA
jgi:fatty acid CoA ligase FadD9